ncbi:MAG: hypothetical protein RBR67_08320 [Desulfobacterium sp.]|jgi:hypothetical protein|nr:hypothetical protein [Desulfobacterium sp.]
MNPFTLKEIASVTYKRPDINCGYTDKSLHINVSDNTIAIKDIEEKTKQTFIGGKGRGVWHDRWPGHPADEEDLCQGLWCRPDNDAGDRHGGQGA